MITLQGRICLDEQWRALALISHSRANETIDLDLRMRYQFRVTQKATNRRHQAKGYSKLPSPVQDSDPIADGPHDYRCSSALKMDRDLMI
jgi:hypothetical protein